MDYMDSQNGLEQMSRHQQDLGAEDSQQGEGPRGADQGVPAPQARGDDPQEGASLVGHGLRASGCK